MGEMTKTIKLEVPALFDFDQCLFFLDRGYNECLYQLENRKVHRAILYKDNLIPFTVTANSDSLLIEIPEKLKEEETSFIGAYVTEWFDLNRDIKPFYQLLSSIQTLSPLKDNFDGLRLIGIPDLFEAMCWSIIGQQINLTFAFKLKRRLVEFYGQSLQWNGHQLFHFPTPAALVHLDEKLLRANQFSRGKIQYLRNVALAFTQNGLSKETIRQIPDFESRQKKLIEIKGIGIWSANYALMKTLHQPEAIPFGDTGLTQALFNHQIIDDRKDETAIKEFFQSVKGWEAYTVFYLWRSLAG